MSESLEFFSFSNDFPFPVHRRSRGRGSAVPVQRGSDQDSGQVRCSAAKTTLNRMPVSVSRVLTDLDAPKGAHLMGPSEEGSLNIVTLLLTGRATPYLHNGVVYVGDEDHYVSTLRYPLRAGDQRFLCRRCLNSGSWEEPRSASWSSKVTDEPASPPGSRALG